MLNIINKFRNIIFLKRPEKVNYMVIYIIGYYPFSTHIYEHIPSSCKEVDKRTDIIRQ